MRRVDRKVKMMQGPISNKPKASGTARSDRDAGEKKPAGGKRADDAG